MYLTVANHNSEKVVTGFETKVIDFKDIPYAVKNHSYCSNSLKDGKRVQNIDKTLPTGYEAYNGQEDILILDIDDGVTIEQMKLFFGDFNYIIVTTKSHRKLKNGVMQGDRFRLFLEVEVINNYEDRVSIISEIYKTYFFIDQSVKSTNRFFYKSPEDAEVILNITGQLFDTRKYIRKMQSIAKISFLDMAQATKQNKATIIPSEDIYHLCELRELWIDKNGNEFEYSNGELNTDAKLKGALTVLDNEFYSGNRNNAIFKVGAMLHADGLDNDTIANFLIAENDKRDGIKFGELTAIIKSICRL